jgi:hypothetical protein
VIKDGHGRVDTAGFSGASTSTDTGENKTHGMCVPGRNETGQGLVGKIVRDVCRVCQGLTSGMPSGCMGASGTVF